MKAIVKITLKSGILDPQGRTVHQALEHLGYENIERVFVGKMIEIYFPDDMSEEDARKQTSEMAERLLANPVMEKYTIEIEK
ncbi:MAG: phosphoribosylformylglycinamidine synthase subunit PurS [Calditrichia bacterium]